MRFMSNSWWIRLAVAALLTGCNAGGAGRLGGPLAADADQPPAAAGFPRAEDLVVVGRTSRPASDRSFRTQAGSLFTSPDGLWVAKLEELSRGQESTTRRLTVARAREGTQTFSTEVTNLSALAWSPDGRLLAYCEGLIVHVVDSDGQSSQTVYVGPGGPYPGACSDLRWSPEGDSLIFRQIANVFQSDLANPLWVTIEFDSQRRRGVSTVPASATEAKPAADGP